MLRPACVDRVTHRLGQERQQCLCRTQGCTLLRMHDVLGTPTQALALFDLRQQIEHDRRQLLWCNDTQGIRTPKDIDDVPEVLGMWPNQDRYAEMCGLKHVMSALG